LVNKKRRLASPADRGSPSFAGIQEEERMSSRHLAVAVAMTLLRPVQERSRRRRRLVLVPTAALAATACLVTSVSAATSVKPYAVPIGGNYQVKALFSADDKVPLLGGAPGQRYRMVGIPDGLGAHPNGDGTSTLFMNHELTNTTLSEPIVGGPKNRGTYVSQWLLDDDGDPIAGRRAYDTVFNENTPVGPAPDTTNTTRALSRFCSGFLAGPQNGFDRWIYLTNEEEQNAANTFDAKGSVSVAIFDNELHSLPRLGHFPKENTVVQPHQGTRTVIFSTEDGPATLDNQLYMYVGKQDRSANASVLSRNGLDNGALYVFRSLDATRNSERTFITGSVRGEWVPIPNADVLTDVQLEAASDAENAMTFVRPEDGAFNPNNSNEFFFNTTGSSSGVDDGVNELGRLYSLRLHPGNPLEPATLTIVYNADLVVAAGGDIAISPDNIDVSSKYLMINEDGTTESRLVMAAKGRDGSIWRFDLVKGPVSAVGVDASNATRVVELDPPGRDGVAVGPGIWETSGIIDTSMLFGADSWLSDVQAHPPTTPPGGPTVTVEDGQLFLMTPAS
jgi:secreted PhoX family phosphatase